MCQSVRLVAGTVLLITALAPRPGAQISPPGPIAGMPEPTPVSPSAPGSAYVPPMAPLPSDATSELRDLVTRYTLDRAALLRRYAVERSPARREKLREFHQGWIANLSAVPFERLSQDGKVDYVLMRNRLDYELELLDRADRLVADTAPLLPFEAAVLDLWGARRRMETIDPRAAASVLDLVADQAEEARRRVETGLTGGTAGVRTTRIVGLRAVEAAGALREVLQQWFQYYDGYDPLFSWWTRRPYGRADKALESYAAFLRERLVGVRPGEEEPIVGNPIGRGALLSDLEHEMIPYSPEELIAIAEREYEWCLAEARKAAREMGFGDDWRAALEKVKNLHVEPGRQPDLIRDLAYEAIDFLEAHDLVTIEPLARDIWRIEMMPPERQRVNPFFLGGEIIQVSYPTDTMEHGDKLMSLRGNAVHFSRATVQHELIPGHHLQGYMTARYNSHRSAFGTPFWGEGWALYWEMLLWDRGFPRSAEDRIGMLFWRMHRTARIIFSLKFHLGEMTPQECIDFLVERVGHERFTAEGEVRRSFNGTYSPLYQVAYMIGGLQFRALHQELVGAGRMTDRAFHDRILRLGRMPVEMVRATMIEQPLSREHAAGWRFYGNPAPARRAGPDR